MKKLLILTLLLFTSAFFYAQEIKFGKVSKEELEEKFYPLDSTADAVYLLKKRRTFFRYDINNGFEVVTEYHDRIKIYSKEGLKHALKNITYYKPESGEKEKVYSIKSYTFNLENDKIKRSKLTSKNIFEERISKFKCQKKITFPKVTEKSIIDITYKHSTPFWEIRTMNFQHEIPVKQVNYVAEIPEYFIFSSKPRGYYNIPLTKAKKQGSINWNSRVRNSQRTSMGSVLTSNVSNHVKKFSLNVLTYTGSNIPSLKDKEPYTGNLDNYRATIEFELSGTQFPNSIFKNYSTTWSDVCKTIYKSSNFGAELEKTSYYKDDLSKILTIANNDFEKAALIFQFVKAKIKWNDYYGKYTEKGVKKAYKEGIGNAAEINLALTSMLRSSGLKANPVLVSTKNNGIPLYPTREGYNYVITKVNFSTGKSILLDATDQYSIPNVLPNRVLNWYGREIHKNGSSNEVKLTPSHYSKENNLLHIKIEDTGEVSGLYRKTLTNHFAKSYRKKNNIKKEEDIISSIEEKNSIEIDEFKVLNKTNLSKSLIQNIKFSSEDLVEELNDKLYISPLFFLATKENPFKSETRNFPIDFGIPWQEKFSISITIPEGYSVQTSPKDLAIGLPENMGVFKYKTSIQNNKIKLLVITQLNTNIIPPNYYSELKEFYKQLVEKQTEKIVLRKLIIK
ncbi:hypothetical protein WH52_10540 [Tenacibaculum holothuriorum]|uniref:Transglutaminase-like domain-containing protein n=1 Tax=Tenacibaculum holothuriorum TaxID=1635173 RepID=A0A1Y2PCX8_9FLAO|nr:transglutaminase domain-containing protein [Tenacibaculum holothuriorum]OSY87538.1 hypothetical protein WH52_10540 [Tenacibaculum holothuriorum]